MALTVAQLVARVTADTSGFYKSMAIMNSSLIRTGSFASRALAGIGLATTGIGILSLRAAGNFQQAMNILEAVSGGTQGQMQALRKEAIALGKDFKLPNVSAKDAADAMVELSKSGLSVDRVLGATRGTLQLGLAANIGFADSAKLAARALQAFDLGGKEANRVANLLAAGANKSTAEISDLALGLQNAGAQFHGVGMSMEDLVASLAILADNGLAGEYAGTALKTMLIRLTSPTDKAAKVMDELGLKMYDAQGNMKSMPAIIANFQKSLGGLTQQQREQALTTIFGVRANQAMRILMGEGSKEYAKYRGEITGTNAAVAMATARTKGFNGAMGALGSAVETLAIQLGTAMLPAAESIVRAMANLVASIDPSKIIGFFSAIADGIRWFKNLVDHSIVLRAALIGVVAALGAFVVISMITALVTGLAGAFAALGAVLLANPIVLIAAALIGLGAALYYAYQNSETFRNAVNSAFEFLKGLIPTVQNFGREVMATFQQIWATVGPTVKALANIVISTYTNIYDFIHGNTGRIKAVVMAEWTIISTFIKTNLQNLIGIIKFWLAVLHGDWGEAWNQLKGIVQRTLSGAVTIIRALGSLAVNAMLLLAKGVLDALRNGLSTVGDVVRTALQAIKTAITNAVGWVFGEAKAIGKAIIDGIVSGLGDIAGSIAGKLKSGISSAIGSVKGAFGIGSPSKVTAEEIGKPLSQGITEGMLLGIQDLPTKMSDKIKAAVDAAKKTIDIQLTTLSSSWDRMAGDALRAFDAITEQFQTKAEKALAAFDIRQKVEQNKKAVQELVDKYKEAQQALMVFSATPREQLTQNEGESTDAFNARKYAAEQEWNNKFGELQRTASDALQAIQDEKAAQALEKKRAALVAQADESRKQYNAQRELARRNLQDQLDDLIASLKQHPEKWRFYQNKVLKLMGEYGVNFRGAGLALGRSFASGLLQAQEEVQRAAQALAQTVEQYLATHSPAEKGPLSRLDHFWDSFGKTLVSGLDSTYVSRAAAGLAGAMGVLSPGTSLPMSAGALGAGSATGTNIYVNMRVEGSLIRQQDLADEIYNLVSQNSARGKTLGAVT